MTSAFLSRRAALLAAVASSLLIGACGGGGGGSGGGQTSVRALNLSSDIASLDIYTGETKQFSAQASAALSNYVVLDANTYTLNVRRAGDAATLLTGSYALSKDKNYTAVVWGRETALRLSTLPEDENTDEITTGNTRVRVFNATTDTGSVDVFLTTATANLADTAVTQGALGSGTLSGFRDLSAGTYRLRITGVGDPNDVRLDVPAVTLESKKYATIVLTAGTGGALVNGTLIAQRGSATAMPNTQARVRTVASMNNAGIVAVSVGGRTLAGALRSPSAGPYALVDAGAQSATVRVNGAVIETATRTFLAGSDYTLMVYGPTGAGLVQQITDDNRLPSSSSRVKIRLVHGASGIDPLTLSIDALALVSDQASGTVSAYTSAASNASVRIEVTAAAAADPLYTETAFNLKAQGVYTVFMLGGNTTPKGVIRQDR